MNTPYIATALLLTVLTIAACSKPTVIQGTATVAPSPTLQATPTQLPIEQVPAIAQATATVAANPTVVAAASTAEVNITVGSPKGGDRIKGHVNVTGRARVYEATVQVVVKDSGGNEIGTVFATATAAGPEWGEFEIQVPIKKLDREQDGTVEVFSYSPRDGSMMNLVLIPVTLLPG